MTAKDPSLYTRTTDDVILGLETEMAKALESDAWALRTQDAGHGMIRLFGRMAEVIANRLNRVPEQHFRAFLNMAEIDRLPPRPACTELTFTAAEDGPPAVVVPAATQVSTRPSPEQPEIIFETEQDLTVVPTTLARCVVMDPLNYSDRTGEANGDKKRAFDAFAGRTERTRIFFIADDRILTFDDDSSRNHAAVVFDFKLAEKQTQLAAQGENADGWSIAWLYWDGEKWTNLLEAEARIEDGTDGFQQNGSILFTNLPDLGTVEVDGHAAAWLACKLSGGVSRSHLPTVTQVKTKRIVTITDSQVAAPDSGLVAIQAGSVLFPVDPSDTFQPFGPQPGALDTFYLRINEAFTKSGATVTAKFALEGLPEDIEDMSEIDQLALEWEYYTADGWLLLGRSRRGCPAIAKLELDREPEAADTAKVMKYAITRATFLEMDIPDRYGEGPFPPAYAQGKILTDIYTGKRYVQFPLPDACSEKSARELITGHYTTERLGFRDSTLALTASGTIQFQIPTNGDGEPSFAKTTVGDEEGYWIRARLADGSYNVPQQGKRGIVARCPSGCAAFPASAGLCTDRRRSRGLVPQLS